ncbi:hypothetical protein B484DRAFT_407818, partial [Ochromonadaceae sp. CCMP2298]
MWKVFCVYVVNKQGVVVRKDLHLHRDLFLHTRDADVAELMLLQNHPHAANHPEEGMVSEHHMLRKVVHVEHHHDPLRHAPIHQEVSEAQLKRDAHLHHDLYLSTQ